MPTRQRGADAGAAVIGWDGGGVVREDRQVEIRTTRLVLRRWQGSDRAPFAAMNAHPVVMEHFPARPHARRERRVRRPDRGALRGARLRLWALDDGTGFVGFTGPRATFEAPFNPSLEVGWRLAHHAWGKGYATEAATAAVRHGLTRVDTITSFTAVVNERSWRVMDRIGMRRAGEFDHPTVPEGHPVRRHLLYRADRQTWSPHSVLA